MKKTYYVYIHICPNNMVYVGVTTNPKNRWMPSSYKKHNDLFAELIDKYGWENIEHKILFRLHTRQIALKFEDLLICFFRKKGLCINQQRSGLIKAKDKNAYNHQWREDHREECNDYLRQYRQDHYEKNKEKNMEHQRKVRSTTEGKIYNMVNAYNQHHPDKIIITPLEAKNNYLQYGIIPNFIKNDDLCA